MSITASILSAFGINLKTVPTGANAVVTDYKERQDLSERKKEVNAKWDEVERIANDGYFNSVTEANIHFDLGEYGEKVVTLNLEDELPEFMGDLNLSVEQIPHLIQGDYNIPMIREGGEWRIHWEKLPEWSLYNNEDNFDPSSE